MARLRRRKAAPPPPPVIQSVECQCEGVWHAYAALKVGGDIVQILYRIGRDLSGVWGITVQLPRLDRVAKPVTGWATLREALAACDLDAREECGLWAELLTAA